MFARHHLLARATRAGTPASASSPPATPTSVHGRHRARAAGGTIDGDKVPGALRSAITANGGQDHLKGKILRIAHCGYFGAFDILTSLSGGSRSRWRSSDSNDVDHGAGVGAAQRVFVEAGVPAAA